MKDLRLRLSRGSWRLDQWAASAGQIQRNAVHEALFAILDGSVFRRYRTLDDVNRGREFFVIVREDLVIKASVANFDAFGLLYIGHPDNAPDLELVPGHWAPDSTEVRPGAEHGRRS